MQNIQKDNISSSALQFVSEEEHIRENLSKSVLMVVKNFFKQENSNGLAHDLSKAFEKKVLNHLSKAENKTKLVGALVKQMEQFNIPSKLGPNNVNLNEEIAHIGLETLVNELKVYNLNQETTALKKLNDLNQFLLAYKIKDHVADLKAAIQKNKDDHSKVKNALSSGNLENLEDAARLINPNAKDLNKDIQQEIDDFLNGGDLIL